MREPLREQLREVQAQRMTQSQIFDALRELLSDAQRPAFDLNRAQLVAEGQQRDPAARNAPLSDPPGPSS